MKEIYIQGEGFNAYVYVIDNKFYFLEEKINFNLACMKSKVYRKKAEEILSKKAYLVESIPSARSLKMKKNLKSFLSAIMFTYTFILGSLAVRGILHDLSEEKNHEIYIEDYKEAEQDQDLYHDNLAKMYEYIEKYNPTDEEINVMVDYILLSDFESREEGFLFYAINCINQNNYFTDKEKNALKNELETKIMTFGKYYEGHTILKALKEYANVPVKRKYWTTTATFTHKDEFGLITYNPSWEDCYQALNHELSHSESMGETVIPFFSETGAAFLSNQGYPISRKVMTIFGILGDNEIILKSLINFDYDAIKENLLSKFSGSDKVMMQNILSSIEQIEDPADLEKYFIGNEELITQINALYLARYGKKPEENVILNILEDNIRYGESSWYSCTDNLLLNDQLILNYNSNEANLEIEVKSTFTNEDYARNCLKSAINYFKENNSNYEEDLVIAEQNHGTYWLTNIITAEDPYLEFCYMNELQVKNNLEPISVEYVVAWIMAIKEKAQEPITVSLKEDCGIARTLSKINEVEYGNKIYQG